MSAATEEAASAVVLTDEQCERVASLLLLSVEGAKK